MKIIITVLCLCVAAFAFGAPSAIKHSPPELVLPEQPSTPPQQDPLILLRDLIQTTSQQLKQQKTLEQSLMRFQKSRAAYIADTQDRQAAMCLVTDAHAVLKIVQEQHLSHLLPPAFMKEISFFAKFAEKQQITSP